MPSVAKWLWWWTADSWYWLVWCIEVISSPNVSNSIRKWNWYSLWSCSPCILLKSNSQFLHPNSNIKSQKLWVSHCLVFICAPKFICFKVKVNLAWLWVMQVTFFIDSIFRIYSEKGHEIALKIKFSLTNIKWTVFSAFKSVQTFYFNKRVHFVSVIRSEPEMKLFLHHP